MLLQHFKNFIADRLELDELIALAAFGRGLRAEYETHDLDEPDWIDLQLKSLRREIRVRVADSLERRKREIELRLENMKTPSEKKKALLTEKKKIEEQLAATA